jgi:hypothetical protein
LELLPPAASWYPSSNAPANHGAARECCRKFKVPLPHDCLSCPALWKNPDRQIWIQDTRLHLIKPTTSTRRAPPIRRHQRQGRDRHHRTQRLCRIIIIISIVSSSSSPTTAAARPLHHMRITNGAFPKPFLQLLRHRRILTTRPQTIRAHRLCPRPGTESLVAPCRHPTRHPSRGRIILNILIRLRSSNNNNRHTPCRVMGPALLRRLERRR